MFAHQVIEDINKLCFRGKDFITGTITSAKKFHVGNTSNLSMATKILVGKSLFWDHAEYCRLPFRQCWFDYVAEDDMAQSTGRKTITKRGILCGELADGLIYAIIFICDQIHGWTISPVQWLISINRDFLGYKDNLRHMFGQDIPTDAELMNVNFLRLPSFIKHEGEINFTTLMEEADRIPHLAQHTHDDTYELMILQSTLMLLNCRNVITVYNHAPERLNAKRLQKGKHEIFAHRTIQIEIPSKRYLPGRSSQPGEKQMKRVHLCRGHFKIFTESAPLFGKCTGIYWWQPQVRGTGSETQSKDYRFKPRRKKAS